MEHSECGGFVVPGMCGDVTMDFDVVGATGVIGLPVRVGIIGGIVVTGCAIGVVR